MKSYSDKKIIGKYPDYSKTHRLESGTPSPAV